MNITGDCRVAGNIHYNNEIIQAPRKDEVGISSLQQPQCWTSEPAANKKFRSFYTPEVDKLFSIDSKSAVLTFGADRYFTNFHELINISSFQYAIVNMQ